MGNLVVLLIQLAIMAVIVILSIKLILSILLILVAFCIGVILPLIILFALSLTIWFTYQWYIKNNLLNKTAIAIPILALVLGVSLGGLIAGTWLRLYVPTVIILSLCGFSGTILTSLLSYPYVKHLLDVYNYRKKESNLIKL
jgi:hypothetical protein